MALEEQEAEIRRRKEALLSAHRQRVDNTIPPSPELQDLEEQNLADLENELDEEQWSDEDHEG